jgi:hypothetical protein
VSDKTKVKHAEEVACLDMNFRCLKCDQVLVILCRYLSAGHSVAACGNRSCEQLNKQMKVPRVTIKGEWL